MRKSEGNANILEELLRETEVAREWETGGNATEWSAAGRIKEQT